MNRLQSHENENSFFLKIILNFFILYPSVPGEDQATQQRRLPPVFFLLSAPAQRLFLPTAGAGCQSDLIPAGGRFRISLFSELCWDH
jgi:hypothetical protein